MKNNYINYKISDVLPDDATHALQLFVSEWLTGICSKQYNIESMSYADNEALCVSFDSSLDALYVRLSGPPEELQKYIKVVY